MAGLFPCCDVGVVEAIGWLTISAVLYGIVRLVMFMRQDADSSVFYASIPDDAFKGKTVLLVGASSGSE